MKLVIFAHRTLGYKCVKYLYKINFNQFVVIPPNDDGVDRAFKSVKKFVIEKNIPFFQFTTINDRSLYDSLLNFNASGSFSCYFPIIIPQNILSIFKNGSLNLHGGLLPEYMGTFSGVWSIINDEKYSGSTIHFMDRKVDTGHIVERKKVKISKNDTGFSLYKKISLTSLSLFKKYYRKLASGVQLICYKQDFDKSTYYSRKIPYEGVINWNWSSRKVYNFCRALYFPPYKGAITNLDGKEIEIVECKEKALNKSGAPGEVLSKLSNGLLVATSSENIFINRIRINDRTFDSFNDLSLKTGSLLG